MLLQDMLSCDCAQDLHARTWRLTALAWRRRRHCFRCRRRHRLAVCAKGVRDRVFRTCSGQSECVTQAPARTWCACTLLPFCCSLCAACCLAFFLVPRAIVIWRESLDEEWGKGIAGIFRSAFTPVSVRLLTDPRFVAPPSPSVSLGECTATVPYSDDVAFLVGSVSDRTSRTRLTSPMAPSFQFLESATKVALWLVNVTRISLW